MSCIKNSSSCVRCKICVDLNLQVVDDDKGPSTKREYEIARVPAGEALAGKVVDFLGRSPGSQVQLGTSTMVPLFGEQPDMEAREQIAEALLTGVKVRHSHASWAMQPACSALAFALLLRMPEVHVPHAVAFLLVYLIHAMFHHQLPLC